MRTLFRTIPPLAALLAAGCGGGSVEIRLPPPEEGQLTKLTSAAQLEQSLKAGFTELRTQNEPDLALGDGDSGFSQTYTLEVNVDEFDSVKYDGSRLYVAPSRGYGGCCFILDTALPADFGTQRSIRIFETDPASAGAIQVGEIPLADEESVQGMYLTDERMIALTATNFFGHYGNAWSSIAIWVPDVLGLRIYDTSGNQPVALFDATFDGQFVDSRRIGDTVYVVTRYAPFVDGINYWPMTAAERDANEQLLATVTLDDLLPGITVNGQKRALVDPANCYVTNDGSAPAYPVLTNITAIPVNAPENFANTCYNEESIGVHVSETAVYLTQDVPDNDSRNTRLHKFGIGNGAPAYHGSGEIDGSVWTGGQADFRLNETDGRLRVFTTDRLQPGTDMLEHRLFVLAEDQSRLALEVVGSLPNASRPEPIGKPNEDLFGVRFVGQRAYAVTFERIDPLYVIDLSDPSDPRIAGELEVPGVSDLLHPVSDALLLGLGRSADNRLKLELFDVSDIANPLSAGVELLGGPWTYSEATWNRHAFTYLADVNGVDRFTVPADLAGEGPGFSIAESGLYLYEIRDKATPSLASLVPAGSMTIYRDGDADVAASAVRNRGVLDGEAVYFIRDDALYSAFWASPSALNGPL